MKLLTKSRLNHFRNQFVSELLKKNIYIAVIGQSLVHLEHALTSTSWSILYMDANFLFMQRTEREDLQTEYVSSLYMSG